MILTTGRPTSVLGGSGSSPLLRWRSAKLQVAGALALSLSDPARLPLDFTYFTNVALDAATTMETAAGRQGLNISLQLSELRAAIVEFNETAWLFEQIGDDLASGEKVNYEMDNRIVNLEQWSSTAAHAERMNLLDEAGLPGRVWFRNFFVAPGLDTGYAPQIFPQLFQSIQVKDLPGAQEATEQLTDGFTEVLPF